MATSEKAEVPEGEPRARCPSITSSRGSRKKRSNRKKKAKEWTYYIATLKSTIDCLYELCRTEQSINGCKEALMYIQNADRDFRSLIEAINLEQTFSKEVPQAVAWEIRKSASSPISTMILHEMQNLHGETEDGWQIVSHRKRKSLGSSTTTESVIQEQDLPTDDQQNPPPPSVYERLSSGIRYRRNVVESRISSRGAMSGKLMSPRCAMDLPQTRASLAKMSYVRQQIWEKDVKPSLTEKLARQKRERLQRITAPTVSRINFSDPAAVRKRASEYSEQLKLLKQTRKHDERATRARSLHSINESGEGDGGEAGSGSSENGVPKSEPALPLVDLDAEWRELTEEERSLAIEEKSIKEEIEKTESELESMDAELVRQVMEEAEGHPIVEKEPSPPTVTTTTKVDESKKTKKSKPLDEGIKNFLVNHVIGHIHEPGKMAERHEKMCSPKRRCEKDDNDFPRKQEEKLKRADAAREKLQQERTQKLKELAQKREEVLQKQAALVEKKRLYQQKRMEKARENRERNINDIVTKAKSDDHRVMEVQFINTLQDGVWKNELHERDLHLEERKQNLAEERAKKNEERALKGKAAEDRRRKAEQNRVKKLQEKEEKKAKQCERAWKKMCSKINVNSSSKDLPTGEFCLSSLVDRCKWPSSDVLSDPLICVLCSETMSRAFECFVHITGNTHLEKAGISPSSFTEDRLAKEFANLKVLARPSSPLLRPDSAKLQDRSLCLQDLIQYNFKRGNSQFNSTFSPPATSSQPPEAIKKLLDGIETWSSASPDDEDYTLVTEAAKCLEGNKAEREKLASFLIPAADGMMKAVVGWDEGSTPLRFLIKMGSLIDRCSSSPGFALKCLFSVHLHSVFDKINAYSKDNSSSPHLSSLLDMCLCILVPFQRHRIGTIWGVAPETIEERLDCIYDMLSGFSSRIPLILSRGDSSAKWTRVHNLASFFMERGLNENSLSVIYIDHLLHETVEAFRVSTGVDSVDKATRSDSEVTGKLVNKVMHLSERIQQIRKPAVWSALFERPSRSFRFYLILSELLRRSVHRADEVGAVDLIPHLLFLLRCFAAHNPSHQIMCMVGGDKSVVSTICALTDEFFTVVPVAVQTVPTLVLITYENQYAVRKLMSKRCCSHIVAFIKNVSSTEPFRISLNHVLKEVDGEWASAIRFYQT